MMFMDEHILAAAQAAHEANRTYCQSLGDNSQVPWAEAPEWQKTSAINGVKYAIANGFPSGEAMHENWMAEKINSGWVYGETKDPEKKTHPCLVPYSELPDAQRFKDDLFRNNIRKVLGVSE